MISSIRIENLEAFEGERFFDLGACTILQGPNGIGKSTVLRAIELAMTGRVKSAGGTKAARASLIRLGQSEALAEITAQLPGAGEVHTFGQRLSRKSISQTTETPLIDGDPGVSAAETDATRQALLQASPITFDLGAFLSLSDANRRDWIVENIAAAQKHDDIPERIVLAALEGLLGKAAVDTAYALAASNEAALVGLMLAHKPTDQPWSELRTTILELLDAKGFPEMVDIYHRAALDARQRRINAEQALRGSADQLAVTSPEQLAELGRQEEEMQRRLNELGTLIGQGEEARRQVASREAKIAELDAEIAIAATKLDDIADEPAVVAEVDSVKGNLEGLVEQRAAVVLAIRQRATLQEKLKGQGDAHAICPVCQRAFDEAPGDLDTRLRLEIEGFEKRKAELDASISQAGLLLARGVKRIEGWKNAREIKLALLQRRQEWVTFNPDVPPVTAYAAEREELTGQLQKHRAHRDALAKAHGAAVLRAELAVNVEKFRREEQWLKALDAGARQVMQAPVADAVVRLEEQMKALLAKTEYVPFVEMLEGDIAFGAIRNGKDRVPFARLSSGQKCVVGAALAASFFALMHEPPALRVLLIEAGEVDDVHLGTMMQAMGSWDHAVHNIVVATHLFPPAVPGWVYTVLGL